MKKLLLVLLVLAFAGTAHAMILDNPDFEGGWEDQFWGSEPLPVSVPVGWGTWQCDGGGTPTGYLADIAGNPGRGVELGVYPDQAFGGFSFIWNNQKVAVFEGALLAISAYVIDLTPGGAAADFAAFRLEAFGSGGEGLGYKEEKITGVTDTWGNYWMSWLMPAGTTQLGVKLVVSTDDPLYENVGCAYGFDNVAFIPIPEPMTIALLGLGGLFLRRRK